MEIDRIHLIDELLQFEKMDDLRNIDNISDTNIVIDLRNNLTYGGILDEMNRMISILKDNNISDVLITKFYEIYQNYFFTVDESIYIYIYLFILFYSVW